jgi:4a-hydroxytetrahydrobiopterin dehydratase
MADQEIDPLVRMSCVACRRGEPTVTDAEIARFHPQIPDWEVVEVAGVPRLRRVFTFDDFGQSLAFTNRVGALAEREAHHPALLTEWGSTTVNGGRTRSRACTATTSSWPRRRTSCISPEAARSIGRDGTSAMVLAPA